MRWLLHGKLTPAVAEALVRHEQIPVTLAEAGLSESSTYAEILEAAKKKQLDILTADGDLPEDVFKQDLYLRRTIVYLQLEGGDVEQDDAIDRLFNRYKRLSPDRLYTVTETRVKVRQLPARK
jgi:predicted nuclease of predicted toxin-antitoxin system